MNSGWIGITYLRRGNYVADGNSNNYWVQQLVGSRKGLLNAVFNRNRMSENLNKYKMIFVYVLRPQ